MVTRSLSMPWPWHSSRLSINFGGNILTSLLRSICFRVDYEHYSSMGSTRCTRCTVPGGERFSYLPVHWHLGTRTKVSTVCTSIVRCTFPRSIREEFGTPCDFSGVAFHNLYPPVGAERGEGRTKGRPLESGNASAAWW